MSIWIYIGILLNVILWSAIAGMVILETNEYNQSLQIYIAGKYSGDVKNNVDNAIIMGALVQDKTCNYPLVPHAWGYLSEGLVSNYTYNWWIQQDDIALRHSDGLFLISHSPGADKELELAKSLGKPIYYSIDEIPNRCK